MEQNSGPGLVVSPHTPQEGVRQLSRCTRFCSCSTYNMSLVAKVLYQDTTTDYLGHARMECIFDCTLLYLHHELGRRLLSASAPRPCMHSRSLPCSAWPASGRRDESGPRDGFKERDTSGLESCGIAYSVAEMVLRDLTCIIVHLPFLVHNYLHIIAHTDHLACTSAVSTQHPSHSNSRQTPPPSTQTSQYPRTPPPRHPY